MSVYLVVTVAAVSFQNSRMFHTALQTQIQDNTLGLAKKSANTVTNLFETWASLIHVTMHNLGNTTAAQYPAILKSLITSNRELLSFYVATKKGKNQPVGIAYHFNEDSADVRFEDKSAKIISKKLKEYLDKKVAEVEKLGGVKSFAENVSDIAGLPMMVLGYRFMVEGKDEVNWGVLTLWQNRLTAALDHGSDTKSFVVGEKGSFFSSPLLPEVLQSRSISVDSPMVQAAIKGETIFEVRPFRNRAGTQLLGAYHRIVGFKLWVIIERDARAEYSTLNWRIAKTALFAWILLLVALMASFIAASNVTRGLNELTRITLQIASGDFSIRLRPQSRDEVGLLAIAVDNLAKRIRGLLAGKLEAARLEQELKTAQMVQSTLFPKSGIESGPFQVTGFYQPATECGGDWWTHQKVGETGDFLCIGDATGHGAAAAMVVALAFSSCKTLARLSGDDKNLLKSPGKFLEQLNMTLWEAGAGKTSMTFFVVYIDHEKGEMKYANAGHNHPILMTQNDEDARLGSARVRATGRKRRCFSLLSAGNPLGYSGNSTYEERVINLVAGDKLFLYTDGLIECQNAEGEAFGKRRMMDFLESQIPATAEDTKKEVVHLAFSFFAKNPLVDDVTVVVAELSKVWSPLLSRQLS
jgi:serine phosphatase RsbU (regulator of sigma subunit)